MSLRSTKHLTKSLCGIALLLLCSAAIASAQEKFGYVLDLRGEWLANGNSALAKGGAINTNTLITAKNPSDVTSYIVVADRTGNIFQRKSCSAGDCGNPIKVPASAGNDQGIVSRLLGAAMALVSTEPAKYSSFVSRSGGPELQEAVVKMSGNDLDLRDVFKNMSGEKFLLRFEPLAKGKTVRGSARKPVAFVWNPKKPATLNAGGLAPGLYRVSISDVSLLESEGDNGPGENEAWVLIANPEYYAKAAPTFLAAQDVTKKWGSDVRKTAVREFLRASLDFLTAQTR